MANRRVLARRPWSAAAAVRVVDRTSIAVRPCAGIRRECAHLSGRSPVPVYGASQPCDLARLMGHTRAAVLEALRTPRSTAELAACVGTSAPSASEHAAALRASALVQTVRRGRGVNHSLTPLGRACSTGISTLTETGAAQGWGRVVNFEFAGRGDM